MWLEGLHQELSQGDLVSAVPLGSIAAIDKNLKRGATAKSGQQPWFETPDWQPDSEDRGHFLAIGRLLPLVIISWDCEIDKGTKVPILVAPAFEVGKLTPEVQKIVREDKRFAYMLLPPIEALGFPESYVDFRLIMSIARKIFNTSKRLASMHDDARFDLRARLAQFITRVDVNDLAAG